MRTVFLVCNSPGEVATFVKPTIVELRRTQPHWRVQICLVPCPFATGAEADVILTWFPDIPIWTPWESTLAWFKGKAGKQGDLIVFLGGDPWHALLLKKRFQIPALAYFCLLYTSPSPRD